MCAHTGALYLHSSAAPQPPPPPSQAVHIRPMPPMPPIMDIISIMFIMPMPPPLALASPLKLLTAACDTGHRCENAFRPSEERRLHAVTLTVGTNDPYSAPATSVRMSAIHPPHASDLLRTLTPLNVRDQTSTLQSSHRQKTSAGWQHGWGVGRGVVQTWHGPEGRKLCADEDGHLECRVGPVGPQHVV